MKKTKVALLRGAFLNPNELENYAAVSKQFVIQAFASLKPLGTMPQIKTYRLFSPADYSLFGMGKFLLNRTLGDSHLLMGLEKYLAKYLIIDTADPYYYYSYQAAYLKQKLPHLKLISTYCETIPHNNEGSVRKKLLKQFVMANTNLFIVHTQRSKQCLIKEGVPGKKIKIIRLGVDLMRFKPIKKINKPIKILFVGRLVAEKGVWQLYQVFKQLLKTNKKLSLTLAGNGPLKNKILENSQKDGIQNRIKIESVPYSQIHKIYQDHHVFVLPSLTTKTWEEQYGMALVEAMATGLPIVTTNCGAIPEVVGKAGLICKQNKPQEIYQTLSFLLDKPQKVSKYSKISRNRALKHFDRQQFAAKIESIYDQIYRGHFG